MARREYRDPTGKLKGYSQTDTDRTGGKVGGKIMAYILGASIAVALLKEWLGF